ncbi:hypothetical protein ACIBBG_31735 [Micromonospora chersina]|uniref:hypothetical protein n=1 Tax=Micromonospora chersina TaxID=47854 RepID=UPI0037929F27
MQVADRFHLWQNLGQAVEKTVNAHCARLAPPAPPPLEDTPPAVVQPLPEKIVTRLREHYTAVQELAAQGMSKAAIGGKPGLHQATVRKFVNARSLEDLTAITEQRSHLVDPFTGYLHQRWNDGERNATQLFREIQQQGYPGGEVAVQQPAGNAVTVTTVEDLNRTGAWPCRSRSCRSGAHAGTRSCRRPGLSHWSPPVQQAFDQPQQGVTTHGHPGNGSQPCAGTPGQREPDPGEQIPQPLGETGMRSGHAVDLLDEGQRRASREVSVRSTLPDPAIPTMTSVHTC